MATAVVESVPHALEDKDWHDAAYLTKRAQVHQVEYCDRQTDKFISYNMVLINNAHKTIIVKIILMKKMSAFN